MVREPGDSFGVRRQSEASTALWIFASKNIQSGVALCLPPHSKFLSPASELIIVFWFVILGLKPQALCFRLLRRLDSSKHPTLQGLSFALPPSMNLPLVHDVLAFEHVVVGMLSGGQRDDA